MLIRGALVCDSQQERLQDVRIAEGRIVELGERLPTWDDEKVIEADGKLLLPSMIDCNVRIWDDNLTLQNLSQLSINALKGGVGHLLLMPDSSPGIDNEAVVEFVMANTANSTGVRIRPVCNGVRNDGALSEVSILLKQGCAGIYAPSSHNGNLHRRIFEYSSLWDAPIFCRCEDVTLSGIGVMNEGFFSAKLGLPGIPAIAETKEVAKLCEVALSTDAPVVFQSLSSERSVHIIEMAKQEGARVHAEVSIHHLALTEMQCERFNTAAKIKPPLKSDATRKKLLESLKNDSIHLLTSAHSPKSVTKKDLAFEEASFGIDAIDHYFPLLYTHLVQQEGLSLSRLSALTSYHQAQLLKLDNVGLIQEGWEANLMLIDPLKSKKIKSPFSPYRNQEVQGEVQVVWIEGKETYRVRDEL